METENNQQLEKLKKEILSEVQSRKISGKKMLSWNSLIVTVILVVLVFVSLAQATQSATILKKIKSGNVSTATSGSASSPADLQSLPNMVGGC